VPGIGEGFAATFLKQFGTLDNLLANIDQVKGPKKQQSLSEHAETARRARKLVALREDLPLELDWDTLKTTEPDKATLKVLCSECGFHRFLDCRGVVHQSLPQGSDAARPVRQPGRVDTWA
jgi:DNA polymerase-1